MIGKAGRHTSGKLAGFCHAEICNRKPFGIGYQRAVTIVRVTSNRYHIWRGIARKPDTYRSGAQSDSRHVAARMDSIDFREVYLYFASVG